MFRGGGGVSIRPGVVIRMAGRVLLAPPVGVTVYEAGAAVTRGRCDVFTGRRWSMPDAVTDCGPATAYGPVSAYDTAKNCGPVMASGPATDSDTATACSLGTAYDPVMVSDPVTASDTLTAYNTATACGPVTASDTSTACGPATACDTGRPIAPTVTITARVVVTGL